MRIAPPKSHENRQSRKNRPGFTLLEVLLSAAIGVLLMAALYVAMQVQLDHARAGREAVEQSLLARALLRRMSNDIAPSLGAPLPNNPTSGAAAGAGAGGGGGAGAGAGGAAVNSTSSTSSTAPVMNLQGDSGRLILWVSRISSDLNPTSTNQSVTSDLHRITYWLAGGSTSPLGLARQEIKQATSDDALNSTPPNMPDEESFVIAEEVQSVAFRYFDGTSWQDSWDGTQADPTSGAPIGPPQAVEITVTVQAPSSENPAPDNSNTKTYRHVVAIPTANGTQPAQ
jgi:prepilin-type N-terminal cleavage/methylation domain-containing protein